MVFRFYFVQSKLPKGQISIFFISVEPKNEYEGVDTVNGNDTKRGKEYERGKGGGGQWEGKG